MRPFTNLCLVLCLTLSFISLSLGHAHQGRRHHVHRQADLARRDPGELDVYKREFNNARFTYYAVGLGACGQTNVPTDFIVALNSAQYDSGSYCFQMITITANGKTTGAQIMDRCPGCPYGGLDMSQSLFEFFADISAGVVTGQWDFGSGGSSPAPSSSPPPPPPPPSPSPSPSPTPTSVAIPQTTWIPSPSTTFQPPPTTTSAPPTTSSSSSSSTVSSSSSSLTATQTSTNAVAVTAGAVSVGVANSSVLYEMNLSAVLMGELLTACNSMQ